MNIGFLLAAVRGFERNRQIVAVFLLKTLIEILQHQCNILIAIGRIFGCGFYQDVFD